MGLILNIILVAIFFYLLFKIFLTRKYFRSYRSRQDPDLSGRQESGDEIKKSIDMSDIEDADYKEIDDQ
jgi:hypothetical protein